MDKAKKKQSAQVALPDEAQTENDECTQPENSDGGDTEGVLLSDSWCSSASSPSTSMLPSSEED